MPTPNFVKGFLSSGANGVPILITSTNSSSPTSIHTATNAGATYMDEIYLYLNNLSTSSVVVNILWGGSTLPNNQKRIVLQAGVGDVLAVAGCILNGGLTVSAYADTGSIVTVTGYVHTVNFS